MVASKDSSAPLVVVIGSTGVQGGSVVKHLIASDKPYRIHGVTRDTSKPAAEALAKQGLTVVSADISNKEDLVKIFTGADIVFAVTNYWAHADKARDFEDGKRIVDSVKETGVKLLVWSGLAHVAKLSNGKYTKVEHFDVKAEVVEYAKGQGVPIADVQPAGYSENFLTMFAPRKQEDGTFVISSPTPPETVMSLINCGRDYGAYVRAAIETPELGAGSVVLACVVEITMAEITKRWSEITGKTAKFVQMPNETFLQIMPGAAGEDIIDMLAWFKDFGYYGGQDIKPSQKYLKEPAQSFDDFIRESDWSKIIA